MVSFEFQSWGEGSRPSHGSSLTQARIFVYDTDSDNFLEYQAVGGALHGVYGCTILVHPILVRGQGPTGAPARCMEVLYSYLMLYGDIVWTTYGL